MSVLVLQRILPATPAKISNMLETKSGKRCDIKVNTKKPKNKKKMRLLKMIFLDTMKTCFRFHVTFIFQFPIYLEPFAPICEYIRYLYRFLGSKYVGNRKMKSFSRCKNASVQRRSLKRTWPRVAPNEGDALWLSSGRPRQHKTQGRSRIPATS